MFYEKVQFENDLMLIRILAVDVQFYLLKIYFEWPNSNDNIVFEHQGQFGRIECAMSLG